MELNDTLREDFCKIYLLCEEIEKNTRYGESHGFSISEMFILHISTFISMMSPEEIFHFPWLMEALIRHEKAAFFIQKFVKKGKYTSNFVPYSVEDFPNTLLQRGSTELQLEQLKILWEMCLEFRRKMCKIICDISEKNNG